MYSHTQKKEESNLNSVSLPPFSSHRRDKRDQSPTPKGTLNLLW